ncbi:MAG: hypothetical protein HY075_12525, partial [Deltaproteobacteria bacterium]|nr:hypothetical protein [Deltaproteobacteria bacterium]
SPAAVCHAANVALHLAASLLVYELLAALAGAGLGASVGALLFACHPLQPEAVAWCSSFTTLLCAVFGFAGLLLDLAAPKTPGLASFFFVASILSKPLGVVFPAIAFVLRLQLLGEKPLAAAKALLLAAAVAALALVGTSLLQSGETAAVGIATWLRPFEALRNLGFYAGKALVPAGLSPNYPMLDPARLDAAFWAGAVGGGLVVALIFARTSRIPVVARTGVAVFTVALLPVLGIVPFLFQHYSENSDRYAYVALAGLSLGLAAILNATRARAILVLSCAFVVACGVLSSLRTGLWRDELTLADEMLSRNPGSFVARSLRGSHWAYAQRWDLSLPEFRAAYELSPENADHFRNLETNLAKLARLDELAAFYRSSERRPKFTYPAFALANLTVLRGDAREGIAALRSLPEAKSWRYAIGEALLRDASVFPKARAALDDARSALPDYECLTRLRELTANPGAARLKR